MRKEGEQLKIATTFWFAIIKLGLFAVILYYGLVVTNEGYQSALRPPPPETKPPFQVQLKPEAGPHWGDLKITMQTRNAFVVGEPISTNVELDPFLLPNETATIMMVFPDSISILQEDEWANFTKYEELIVFFVEGRFFAEDTISQNLTLWYVTEGIFGVNVTFVRFGYPDGMQEFSYPDIVHIKSYSYLEERQNAQLTNALNERIFGLTIIAVSPIAVQIMDLVEKAYGSLTVKRRRRSRRTKKEDG